VRAVLYGTTASSGSIANCRFRVSAELSGRPTITLAADEQHPSMESIASLSLSAAMRKPVSRGRPTTRQPGACLMRLTGGLIFGRLFACVVGTIIPAAVHRGGGC
jgi:hypothetical protein